MSLADELSHVGRLATGNFTNGLLSAISVKCSWRDNWHLSSGVYLKTVSARRVSDSQNFKRM